jgi:hypothetical protein
VSTTEARSPSKCPVPIVHETCTIPGVEFIFGLDAMPNLVQIAQDLEKSAWKPMKRRRDEAKKPAKPRAKRPNYKEQIVVANEYLNKRLISESIAEFDYQPGKCDRTYRVVVLRKEVQPAVSSDCLTKRNRHAFSTSPTHRSNPSQLAR